MLTLLFIGLIVFLIARWMWPTLNPEVLRKPDINGYSCKNEFLEEYGDELGPPDNNLPEKYGATYLSLMARDPHWLYAHWEISPLKIEETVSEYGYSDIIENSKPVVRVYDITGIRFDGTNARSHFDYDITEDTHNLHISVPGLGRTYCVELGRKMTDGAFLPVLRSNPIDTPRLDPAYEVDKDWQYIEGIYQGMDYFSGASSAFMAGNHNISNQEIVGYNRPVKH